MKLDTFATDRTPQWQSRAAIDACVRHAAAANGFGGVARLAFAPSAAPATARSVRRAAPARQPEALSVIVARAWRVLVHYVGALMADRRRARLARDTDAALRTLDDRALHDLGLDRSEISSIAAAHGRRRDTTRVRMSRANHGLVV